MECLICFEESPLSQMPCCGANIHSECRSHWSDTHSVCPVCDLPLLTKLTDRDFATWKDVEKYRSHLYNILVYVLKSNRTNYHVWYDGKRVPFEKNEHYLQFMYQNREFYAGYNVIQIDTTRLCWLPFCSAIRYVICVKFDVSDSEFLIQFDKRHYTNCRQESQF